MTERESYRQIFSSIAEKRMRLNQCPNCGKPKEEWNRRTDWRCCSVKCTKEFWAEHNKSWSWQQFRYEVFKRDNFTCQKCGNRFTKYSKFDGKEYPDDSNLIADHIKPLAIGGEMWEIDNLQTLCIECNKIKTRQDRKDIANYKNGKLKVRTEQIELIN